MRRLFNIPSRPFTLENFIPEIWSAQLLKNLRDLHVYAQGGIVNRDYEGEISDVGDTVRINNIGPVAIQSYTKNTDLTGPAVLTDAQRTLLIDQAKAFHFYIDDIDKTQQKPKVMSEAMVEAGDALASTADAFIAGLYTDADAGNDVGSTLSPIVPTTTTAYNQLVALRTKLTVAKVPRAGRWVVVPPEFYGLLLQDSRFIDASASADGGQALRNGQVGRAAGFDVLESNAVPDPDADGTSYKIIAGHPMAITYAEQVNQVEGYRPEARFGDAMKGLHLYGAKVVRPTALAVLTADLSGV